MIEVLIVDYKLGNIISLKRAIEYLNFRYKISDKPEDILNADMIILPGVGAYPYAMRNLKQYNLIDPLIEKSKKGTKILGICLGMQLLMTKSFEFKQTLGLGLIDGNVLSINKDINNKLKLPSIGWYKIKKKDENSFFKNLNKNLWYYFVHSYKVDCKNKNDVLASYYVEKNEITAVIKKENIYGLQFHPENSGIEGLGFLQNFFND